MAFIEKRMAKEDWIRTLLTDRQTDPADDDWRSMFLSRPFD